MQTLEAPKVRRAGRWFDVRHRKLGMWAYVLNRITGIALVVYLYLHLGVLSLLARGPGSWDGFISLARQPYFLALDVILLAGMLIHGLNGLRVVHTGLGFHIKAQKALFAALMLVAAGVFGFAVVLIYGG